MAARACFTIAVSGPSGFIGSSVVARARSSGLDVVSVPSFRHADAARDLPVAQAAVAWRDSNRDQFETIVQAVAGAHVVVHAAGLAEPDGTLDGRLRAANAVHPVVAALAARAAGVPRFVHVSSAVVQGRLDPLDETPKRWPLSLYAEAKAEGEAALLSGRGDLPEEVVVYRPTSVLHASRGTTRRLARLLAAPIVPVVGSGDLPVPVALLENVAAGIVFASRMENPPPIVLQPSEGLTALDLVELFSTGRVVRVPRRSAALVRRLVVGASNASERITPLARRLELLLWGQGTDAVALASAGFTPPVGADGWQALARELRRRSAAVDSVRAS